jgi:hypothetical protein
MGDKEVIDGIKALAEIGQLLQGGRDRVNHYLEMLDPYAKGEDPNGLVTFIDKVTDEDVDTVVSMLIVAIGSLSKVRVTVAATDLEKDLATSLGLPEKPEPEPVTEKS